MRSCGVGSSQRVHLAAPSGIERGQLGIEQDPMAAQDEYRASDVIDRH
jgi:hypothetical protein